MSCHWPVARRRSWADVAESHIPECYVYVGRGRCGRHFGYCESYIAFHTKQVGRIIKCSFAVDERTKKMATVKLVMSMLRKETITVPMENDKKPAQIFDFTADGKGNNQDHPPGLVPFEEDPPSLGERGKAALFDTS
jgi:hypothetical protein